MTGSAAKSSRRHYEDFRDPDKVEEGGVVRISGAFLLDHEDEILNLVKEEGKLAEARNPKAKVSSITKAGNGIVVETSSHNLALKIGKALSHAYKGEHTYKFLKGEKFVEVIWQRD
ncbi:hypothetical protein A2291_08495 [candidate division WOR-1 bacterium RIFOXYB2_FULL_42_35]|uniref:Uncharacterized protein n=1 Tax=candidate division WOR-1 bacterium RIFOXYC2_FULL_41_25 TaxID=1802586 RepID=A0A1F4TM15_UNCSA|nr:MAG: hypothetical protein A2247_05190 [candidate division WOR-1 bacterium RIFOXYA2_FULL_41_14]OGC23883.1 MAG: hypothetical protein A2291_08495 [candidate division WOR-1 bacterium RIFOXYB2_FULL_42_35]OGC33758.1 MAG: hypothetical protein A2462_00585 [candidate division WOR-1 bacterium RIFOXYC2_FULL_41_25]OGC44179.1 MAG: hypothetical protein A2548_02955 [candidate division WOR-1 bacterium RIFOXYD2_FULL_41_8]